MHVLNTFLRETVFTLSSFSSPLLCYFKSLRFARTLGTHSSHAPSVMTNYDDLDVIQKSLLDENCILVDKNDEIIGTESKKNSHLKSNIQEQKMLHRAFSVFLFSQDGHRMFLQQRALSKITFPGLWSNACCSHPIADISAEMEGWLGVRKAAIRRMGYELGMSSDSVCESDFVSHGRVHYMAENSVKTDPEFMEHEIDYLLVIEKDLVFDHLNENEVMDSKWVDEETLKKLLQLEANSFTPWFRLIASKGSLFSLWDNLKKNDSEWKQKWSWKAEKEPIISFSHECS